MAVEIMIPSENSRCMPKLGPPTVFHLSLSQFWSAPLAFWQVVVFNNILNNRLLYKASDALYITICGHRLE